MADTSTVLLTGKTAIVTGGTGGIGAAISRELANRGADVAMVYTNPATSAAADDYALELQSLGGGIQATAIRGDLSDANSPAEIVEETLKRLQVTEIHIIGRYREYHCKICGLTIISEQCRPWRLDVNSRHNGRTI
jgi:NAD(P)-dependent dehydrogenase (short-subunit alcohol dehydrogenase family)